MQVGNGSVAAPIPHRSDTLSFLIDRGRFELRFDRVVYFYSSAS